MDRAVIKELVRAAKVARDLIEGPVFWRVEARQLTSAIAVAERELAKAEGR